MVSEFMDVERAVAHSVQAQPDRSALETGAVGVGFQQFGNNNDSSLIVQMAQIADDIPTWGNRWRSRDRHLRAMLHAEMMLGGAVYTSCVRNGAFRWVLDGPPASVDATHDMLEHVQFGSGWENLWQMLSADLYSQDNGAWMELIRAQDTPESPVISLAHLDSNRCVRTGRAEAPIIFEDEDGRRHLLRWWQVQNIVDYPSPVKTMRGMQICAVSRALRGAQLMRDIFNFRREKMGGRRTTSIHLVSGIAKSELKNAFAELRGNMDTLGFTRWSDPLVLSTVDPERTVSAETVDLASIPDGFELTDEMTWWIVALALAFGMDYQDIAPLQQGNLGNSQQSTILDRKSRGKGPAWFMRQIEHVMNTKGIIPQNVSFKFAEKDPAAAKEEAEVREVEGRWMKAMLEGGALTPAQAQAHMVENGWLSQQIANLFVEPTVDPLRPEPEGPGGDDPGKRVGTRAMGTRMGTEILILRDRIHELAS